MVIFKIDSRSSLRWWVGPVTIGWSASMLPGGESVREGSFLRDSLIALRHTLSGIEVNIPRLYGRRPWGLAC